MNLSEFGLLCLRFQTEMWLQSFENSGVMDSLYKHEKLWFLKWECISVDGKRFIMGNWKKEKQVGEGLVVWFQQRDF